MSSSFWTRDMLAAVCRNVTIGVALASMLIFGRPGAPDFFRETAYPILQAIGLSQNSWTMFGPETSTENRKLGAKIRFTDGTASEWSSPDWRSQSRWDRLLTHRYSKYVEVIPTANYEPAYPALAQFIINQDRQDHGYQKQVANIDIRVFRGSIPDARLGYWRPFTEPIPMDERYSIYTHDYSVYDSDDASGGRAAE